MTNQDVQRWACEVASWREAKGFVTSWVNVTQKLFLTICELAEAGECVRKGQWETVQENGKPEGFPAEIADVAIRILDLIGSLTLKVQHVQPVEVKNCSKDTMLDTLMELTGDLSYADAVQKEDRQWLAEDLCIVLGKLYTISGVIGFDLLAEITSKQVYNHGRPYRHGTVNLGGA